MLNNLKTSFLLFFMPLLLFQSCVSQDKIKKIPSSDLFLITHCLETENPSPKPCGKKVVINNDTIVYKIVQEINQLKQANESEFVQGNKEFIVFLVKITNDTLEKRFLINQENTCIWIPSSGYYHFDKSILEQYKSHMRKLEIWDVEFNQKSMAISFLQEVQEQYYIPTNYFIPNSSKKPALLWEYFDGYYVYEIPQETNSRFKNTDTILREIKNFLIKKGLKGHIQMVDLNGKNGILKGKVYAPKQELDAHLKKWLTYKKIKKYGITIYDIDKHKLKKILERLEIPSRAYTIKAIDGSF